MMLDEAVGISSSNDIASTRTSSQLADMSTTFEMGHETNITHVS